MKAIIAAAADTAAPEKYQKFTLCTLLQFEWGKSEGNPFQDTNQFENRHPLNGVHDKTAVCLVRITDT